MEKIFKKSLALMVSAALCLTAFVGCLTVNAETAGSATVTVGEVTAKTTDTTVEVPVTIAAGADATTGIAAAIFDITVDSAKFDFSKRHWDSCLTYDTKQNIHVSTITNGDFIQPLNGTNNTYRFLVEGLAEGSTDENTLGTFTSATFKLTFDVIDNTAGETAITFNTDTMVPQACNAGTLDLQGNYTGAEEPFSVATVAGKITVQAAGPVLDNSLANALYDLQLLVTNKVGFYYTLNLASFDYDDFELVITKDELNNYNYTGNKVTTSIKKADEAVDKTYAEYGLYYVSYSGIALYEMSLDVEYTLYLYKNGVATSYYTFPVKSLSDLANAYYNNNISNSVNASFAVDLLNMGTAAQVHFGSVEGGNALTSLPLPNASVDQSYATSYGSLTEIEGTRDSEISTLLQVLSAPSLWYTINLSSKGYTTPADLTFTASYYSKANGKTFERVVNGAELTSEEGQYAAYGLYYFGFDQVALCDADKTITLTVENTDGTVFTHEYTVLSQISTVVDEVGTRGDLYRAVASFAASTHNKWPDYKN